MPAYAFDAAASTWVNFDPNGSDLLVSPFVLGETRPTVENTGLLDPEVLVPNSGEDTLTLSHSDDLIENVRFDRFVNAYGQRLTFRNCWFAGPPSLVGYDTSRGLVNTTNVNTADIRFENCLFYPQNPLPYNAGPGRISPIAGIRGHDFTAWRCEIRGTVDGINTTKAGGGALNSAVLGCLIHLLQYWSPDSGLSDNRTHCDCIQTAGNVQGLEIIGNSIESFIDTTRSSYEEPIYADDIQQSGYENFGHGTWALSALMLSPAGQILQDLLVHQNWIDGGHVGINLPGTWIGQTISNVVISENRWGGNHRGTNLAGAPRPNAYGIKPVALTSPQVVITGNTLDGTPANTFLTGG